MSLLHDISEKLHTGFWVVKEDIAKAEHEFRMTAANEIDQIKMEIEALKQQIADLMPEQQMHINPPPPLFLPPEDEKTGVLAPISAPDAPRPMPSPDLAPQAPPEPESNENHEKPQGSG